MSLSRNRPGRLLSCVAAFFVAFAAVSGVSIAQAPGVSVGGRVYIDTDRDGNFGPLDFGIGIVYVTIVGPDGLPVVDINGAPVESAVTDADGVYLFDQLPVLAAGETYTVTADESSINTGTTKNSSELTTAGDSDLGVDFVTQPEGTRAGVRVLAFTTSEGPAAGYHGVGPDAQILPPDEPEELTIRVTNTGFQLLVDFTLSNLTRGAGTVDAVNCDFSELGGPSSGISWSGPMSPLDSFDCTATFSGMAAGQEHESMFTAVVSSADGPVGDPPGAAGASNADYWYAATLAVASTTTTTSTPAQTIPRTEGTTPAPVTTPGGTLPDTGATTSHVALLATTLLGLGATLLLATRARNDGANPPV